MKKYYFAKHYKDADDSFFNKKYSVLCIRYFIIIISIITPEIRQFKVSLSEKLF